MAAQIPREAKNAIGSAKGAISGSFNAGYDVASGRDKTNFDNALGAALASPITSAAATAGAISGALAVAFPDLFNDDASGGSGEGLGEETIEEGDPPFSGGQMPGVSYRGKVTLYEARFQGNPSTLYTAPLPGPITKFAFTPSGYFVGCLIENAVGQIKALEFASGQTWQDKRTDFEQYVEVQFFGIERVDGQPDTGGNLPGPVTITPPLTPPPQRPTRNDAPQKAGNLPPIDPLANIPPEMVLPSGTTPTATPTLPQAPPDAPTHPDLDEEEPEWMAPGYVPPPGGNPDNPPKTPPKATPDNTPGRNGEREGTTTPEGNTQGGTKPQFPTELQAQIDGLKEGEKIKLPSPWDTEIKREEDGSLTITEPLGGKIGQKLTTPKGLIGLGAGVAIGGGLTVVVDDLVGNETGQEAAKKRKTATPYIPQTKTSNCGCNPPIFNALNNLGKNIKDSLANLLGEGLSTAAILADLEVIKKGIGTHGLPASVPGNLANPGAGTRSIGSLAELHLWQTEQLDGLMGQFPNKTTIDLGNGQTREVEQPNVSESLSEILGMLTGLTVTSSQILHTGSRTLMQAGSATQQAHLAGLYAKANADFLGYQGKQAAVDLPMAFTPGKDPWEGFLGEGTQKVKGWQNDDPQDLKAIFAELLHAAAIIRAVYWRKLDARGDFKQQIQQNLRAQSQYIDDETQRKADSSDWDEYLNRVEQGFSQQTGSATPYDRDPSEAPRIRDLSTDEENG